MSNLRSFLANVQESYHAHGRDVTKPGLQAVVSCLFGQYVHSLPRSPFRKPLVLAYRASYVWCRNIYGIEIPYTVKLGRRVVVEHQGGIVIHGQTQIGDGAIIRQGVTCGIRSMTKVNDAPVIGNGVSVGAGACLLGKVVIGDGAQIGANSVVLHNVPAGAVAVGVPARVLDKSEGRGRKTA